MTYAPIYDRFVDTKQTKLDGKAKKNHLRRPFQLAKPWCVVGKPQCWAHETVIWSQVGRKWKFNGAQAVV